MRNFVRAAVAILAVAPLAIPAAMSVRAQPVGGVDWYANPGSNNPDTTAALRQILPGLKESWQKCDETTFHQYLTLLTETAQGLQQHVQAEERQILDNTSGGERQKLAAVNKDRDDYKTSYGKDFHDSEEVNKDLAFWRTISWKHCLSPAVRTSSIVPPARSPLASGARTTPATPRRAPGESYLAGSQRPTYTSSPQSTPELGTKTTEPPPHLGPKASDPTPSIGPKRTEPMPQLAAYGHAADDCKAVYESNERCSSRVSVNTAGSCPAPQRCALYERKQGHSTEVTPGSTCREGGTTTYNAICIR